MRRKPDANGYVSSHEDLMPNLRRSLDTHELIVVSKRDWDQLVAEIQASGALIDIPQHAELR